MELKRAFIDSSLRPFVKGSDYDELEPEVSISKSNAKSVISERLDVNNLIQRKAYILKLLSIKHSLSESTQGLITLLEQFFPKIKDNV